MPVKKTAPRKKKAAAGANKNVVPKAPVTARRSTHRLEMWDTERLVPYIRNPRKNDAVVDRIVASIKEFGFKTPILAKSDGTLIDGHLRLKGAIKLGLKEVPVLLCDEWSDAQVKAFRLLANRSSTWAEFDQGLLSLELQELDKVFADITVVTGFSLSEIEKLLLNIDVAQPPAEFSEYDEAIETEHKCPSCGYKWSGNSS